MAMQSTTWWVHGSAPGGETFFDAALSVADKTITANAGIVEFLCHRRRDLRPDYYWFSDATALRLFGRFARVAEGLGTIVMSHQGLASVGIQQPRRIDLTSTILPVRYVPGTMQHVRLSGLICLQYFANLSMPGDVIIMTGMTGYQSRPGHVTVDTFDGRMGKGGGEQHLTHWIRPFTRSVIDMLPDRHFVFCGDAAHVFGEHPIRRKNLSICSDSTQLRAAIEQPQQEDQA